jgi:1,4-alpha-glucan branching enzyme
MKKILHIFILLISCTAFTQVQNGTFTISPTNFTVNDEITITVSGVDPTIWNAGQPNNIYLWAWYFNSCGEFVSGPINGNGDWNNSEDYLQLTNNGNGTYSYVLTPSAFFADSDISEIGVLVKAKDGTGDKKSQDYLFYVGEGIVINISDPSTNTVVINSGDNLTVKGTINSKGVNQFGTPYEIFFNEVSQLTGSNGFPIFQSSLTNLTTSGTVRVEVLVSGELASCSFEVIIAPTVIEENLPAGMVNGINYNDIDDTKATLVLNAPLKDFVYIAGSFNNYNPDNSYLMKKDPTSGKFWLELTGLTSLQVESYQYWVYALSPVTNSPQLVKTADPFSTLVLSPFDDPWIPSTTFPGLTTSYLYPAGQGREVTVLQTGQTPYSWVVPNFTKPKKEDLIIYQVLIRDFDQNRTYQDLIDRIAYFKNLNVTAIQLLPNMEFEGNESWGYNPSFHMALDKFYGTEDKFKEFVDLCHQNGIAVILDIVLNQAFGRNPMVRMWMDDSDNNGWGSPSSENPYFNQVATHSYSVGEDFNHQSTITQEYVQRVLKHWIEEFKIDGFRWDLTKGFTQNCSPSDETCTNSYQQDRVDILKQYADYSWSLDETHYVIFEHLGGDTEEQEWANYRLGDATPKGIMMWSEMWDSYKNLAQGNTSDFSRMGHLAHGFTEKRTLGYPESHDKDRVMYEMTEFGNNNGGGYDVKNLNTALSRMSALGAVTIPIPGPKMIWHFADLGMDNSIWTCTDGSVNSDYDGNNDGDCKLDTKPQPQWVNNWVADANRNQIYNDWSRLILLKTTEAVFEGDYSITTNTLTPKIYVWDNGIPLTELKNVVILANFDVTTQNVTPNFPYTGTWYDLMDDTGSTSINVTNVTTPISIPAGEFRIYGNQGVTLSIKDLASDLNLVVYPNPINDTFFINKNVSEIKIFDITGKLVKAFKGNFAKGKQFDISNLSQSLYILKITNNSGQQQATKLVKL